MKKTTALFLLIYIVIMLSTVYINLFYTVTFCKLPDVCSVLWIFASLGGGLIFSLPIILFLQSQEMLIEEKWSIIKFIGFFSVIWVALSISGFFIFGLIFGGALGPILNIFSVVFLVTFLFTKLLIKYSVVKELEHKKIATAFALCAAVFSMPFLEFNGFGFGAQYTVSKGNILIIFVSWQILLTLYIWIKFKRKIIKCN